jgi:alpha-galactosidase
LNPEARYSIKAIAGQFSAGEPAIASGAYWMQRGVDVELRGDFQAAAFTLEETGN